VSALAAQKKIRVAVVGAGEFGRNHARVYRDMPHAELIGVVDTNAERARQVAAEFGTEALPGIEVLAGRVDAVSVAVPTAQHGAVGCALLEGGIDTLIEKPMAASLDEADELIAAARRNSRVLQVGHLERFNPAVMAAQKIVSRPMFFEVHRLGVFTPRSLDIDVIFDVMIHDLDILLALVGEPVTDVKAVGIPVVTNKVDIAHARLEFEGGAVANVTASRVSTERVRKMRFFQSQEYVSLDYTRRDVLRVRVEQPGPEPKFAFEKMETDDREPLAAELSAFLEAVKSRRVPQVDGVAGRAALELATRVAQSIQEHGERVQLNAFVSSQSQKS
jgi:predicted dehydrogenase